MNLKACNNKTLVCNGKKYKMEYWNAAIGLSDYCNLISIEEDYTEPLERSAKQIEVAIKNKLITIIN